MSAQSSSSTSGTTSSNSNSASQTNPWDAQQPYLTDAFSNASNTYNGTTGNTQSQVDMYGNMMNYGSTNMGTANSSQNTGSALSSMGTGATGAGLQDLGSYNANNTNNTANNVANAQQYVAGQDIQGQVNAAMQSANQEANYVTNPGIDQTAAASNNVNSSRDAIQHGLVATNLAQTAANDYSTAYNNAYNTGLSLSEQQAEANNSANLGAQTALTSGGTTAANAGTTANTGSVNDASGLYNIASAGATGQNNDPYQSLSNYYGIVGSNNWGSNSTGSVNTTGTNNSTTTYDPSQLSQIGAWTSLAGSLV